MIGSLELADRRLQALFDRHGVQLALEVSDELLAHGERLMRRRIEAIPDGEYVFEDVMEGDGLTRDPVTMRVRLVVSGDRAIVDWTGSDPQSRGPVNATYGVTVSATCNAFLQVSGTEIPRNAGSYGCVKTIAPPGSVVNVRFPGPSVGGNTETQPKLVGMLLGALAETMPDRVMAAEGATACTRRQASRTPTTTSRRAAGAAARTATARARRTTSTATAATRPSRSSRRGSRSGRSRTA
jgi:N-methylhydantoinase B/oxoprolinase/acetone carboxylase alpha subunit